eukprot:scaffold107005_cov43-Prasinocladus_malaysianus.AAC.3
MPAQPTLGVPVARYAVAPAVGLDYVDARPVHAAWPNLPSVGGAINPDVPGYQSRHRASDIYGPPWVSRPNLWS